MVPTAVGVLSDSLIFMQVPLFLCVWEISKLIMSVSIFEDYGGEKLARSGRDGLQSQSAKFTGPEVV